MTPSPFYKVVLCVYLYSHVELKSSLCIGMALDKEVQDYLREIYYDPSHPAGYGSVRSLHLAGVISILFYFVSLSV